MASRGDSQIGKDYSLSSAKKWRTRDIWVFRILVGAALAVLGGGLFLAFVAIGLPVLFIGGGLLIFFSPVLIFIATVTSPIWVPIGGLILATPPILTALSVAGVTCLFFVYWGYNYFRYSKTPNVTVNDAFASVKDAAGKLQEGAFDATTARQRGAARTGVSSDGVTA